MLKNCVSLPSVKLIGSQDPQTHNNEGQNHAIKTRELADIQRSGMLVTHHLVSISTILSSSDHDLR